MITFDHVTKKFKQFTAVHDVSFSVAAGECFALLGPNGAGKTTLVRMLLGFSQPTTGKISIRGIDARLPQARAGIGYLAERHVIAPHLSGREYLSRSLEYCGIAAKGAERTIDELVETVGMSGREAVKIGTMSKGMVQRIGLAGALAGNPSLLILDEPTSGLDPVGIFEIRAILEKLKQRGMTILLNSHLLSEAEKVCDSVGIINQGRIVVKDRLEKVVGEGETLESVFLRHVAGGRGV